jgi:hypothetical protein
LEAGVDEHVRSTEEILMSAEFENVDPKVMLSRAMMTQVLEEVRAERERQEAKWGEQNHPNGTSKEKFEWMANLAKLACDKAASEGKTTYAGILFEEFYEALAEESDTDVRKELIQVAAVTCGWIEAIDRRQRAVRQLSDS